MAALPPEKTDLSRSITSIGVDFRRCFDIKNYTGRACLLAKATSLEATSKTRLYA